MGNEDEEIMMILNRMGKEDVDLLKRFLKNDPRVESVIIEKLFLMEEKYGLTRDQIIMVLNYLRLHKE